MACLLFIDPGSVSTGWAMFNDGKLGTHGTVSVNPRMKVWDRLKTIGYTYSNTIVSGSIDEVHIERMNHRVHHYLLWSVGIIGYVLSKQLASDQVCNDISPTAWQKFVRWNRKTLVAEHKVAKRVAKKVSSGDELAAICMGLYYLKIEG